MRRNYFRPIHPAFVKDVYGLERVWFHQFFSVSTAYSEKSKELLAIQLYFQQFIYNIFLRKFAQAFESASNFVMLLIISKNKKNNDIIFI